MTVTGLNTAPSIVTLVAIVWAGAPNTHGGIAGGIPGQGAITLTNPSLLSATGSPSTVTFVEPIALKIPPCKHCNVPAAFANKTGNIDTIYYHPRALPPVVVNFPDISVVFFSVVALVTSNVSSRVAEPFIVAVPETINNPLTYRSPS